MRVIFTNTLLYFLRSNFFYIILVGGFLLIIVSHILHTLAIDQQQPITYTISIAWIELISLIITLFFGTQLIHKERKNKTITLLYTKQRQHWPITVGLFLGFAVVMIIVYMILGWRLRLIELLSGAFTVAWWLFLTTLLMSFLKIIVVWSVLIMCSMIAGTFMSIISWLVFYYIAHAANFVYFILQNENEWSLQTWFFGIIHLLLPRFDSLSLTQLWSQNIAITTTEIRTMIVSNILYALIMVAIATSLLRYKKTQ